MADRRGLGLRPEMQAEHPPLGVPLPHLSFLGSVLRIVFLEGGNELFISSYSNWTYICTSLYRPFGTSSMTLQTPNHMTLQTPNHMTLQTSS